MKNSTWVKVASLSTVLVGAMSVPAFAGGASTYVENSYNLRNIYNGRSNTEVKIDSNYKFDRTSTSYSTKDGTTSTTTTQSSSGYVDGLNQDQSFVEQDDFVISSSSATKETGWGEEKKSIRVHDSYSYNGFDKTHRVTSGFSY